MIKKAYTIVDATNVPKHVKKACTIKFATFSPVPVVVVVVVVVFILFVFSGGAIKTPLLIN